MSRLKGSLTRISVIVSTIASAIPCAALTVNEALFKYDTLLGSENAIIFHNATLTNYGDTQGGLIVGNNLTVNGGLINAQAKTSGLSLYVGGTLTTTGSELMLSAGYASLPNTPGTWDPVTDRLTNNGTVLLSTINSSDPKKAIDPRSVALNPGFDMNAIKAEFAAISSTLDSAANNGTISVVGQTLTFNPTNPAQHGAIIFDLDASLLSGNTYQGSIFSNLALNISANDVYVINVLNANGKTLFGSGVNYNPSANSSQLIWNFVGSGNVTLSNGGGFYGSVLAPGMAVSNGNSMHIDGQLVANDFTLTGAELHFIGFEDVLPTPEPSTYGLCGAAALLGLAAWRRGAKRRAS